jgi:Ca-activated chloride channel family protein
MSESPRRNRVIAIIVVLLLLLLVLLLVRCQRGKPVIYELKATAAVSSPSAQSVPPAPGKPLPDEVLTTATIEVPAQVNAGVSFAVKWTGPNNAKDYITIVRKDAAAHMYKNYEDTSKGNPLTLLAPIETGEWEVRYVADRSKTVLGRATLLVVANEVTLSAPAEVVAGTVVTASWTGPNNAGDYLTLVPKSTPDGQYGNYTYTTKGSPLAVMAPIAEGDAELRYMTGQGAKVLHRIPVRVVAATIELDAPATAAAGSKVTVKWTGPNNTGDYLTLVPQSLPDGQYASYANTNQGATLTLVAPKSAGLAEIRYMSGQGAKVLRRRAIVITP